MDHLLMGPEGRGSLPSAAVPPVAKSFNGIHIRNLNNVPEDKNITIKANMTTLILWGYGLKLYV